MNHRFFNFSRRGRRGARKGLKTFSSIKAGGEGPEPSALRRAGGPTVGARARARARARAKYKIKKSKGVKRVQRVLEIFQGNFFFNVRISFSVFHSLQHGAFEKIVAGHVAENGPVHQLLENSENQVRK